MRRGTTLVAAVAGVLLLAGATVFAGSAVAALAAPGNATPDSAAAQEQLDPDSSACSFAGGDTDAMRTHMDGQHGAGSFDEMWSEMPSVHGPGAFDDMDGSSGGMMSGWVGQ